MTQQPGTLTKFHIGLAADGMSSVLLFADDRGHSMACLASFGDLHEFIAALTQAAAELARRRAATPQEDDVVAGHTGEACAINVASSEFRRCDDDGYILGALVGEAGEVLGIRMRPDIANEMTRNMLRSAQALSLC
jgi:hypothetical protein